MSKLPSVRRGGLGVGRKIVGSGAGVGGRGKWRFRGGEGEGASHWLSGGSSRDEVDLGPGFPLKIDLNRDKGGNENSLLVCREVTAEQHRERTGRELGVLSAPPFCPPGEYSVVLLRTRSLKNPKDAPQAKASPLTSSLTQQRENLGPPPSGTFPPEAAAGGFSFHRRQHP